MYIKKGGRPRVAQLPDGTRMSAADLPPAGTTRWVASRKAAVVRGVRAGLITLEEAIERYELSEEEFRSWEAAEARHGVGGLKATRIQQMRGTGKGDPEETQG